MDPYQVFHSPCDLLRKKVHFVLVSPEEPGNVGAAVRALANMDIRAELVLTGRDASFLNGEAERFAMHARDALFRCRFVPSLSDLIAGVGDRALVMAVTARIGSAKRPHPTWADEAVTRAIGRLGAGEIDDVYYVFGREGSGLTNEEVALCDWVVSIPTLAKYRSLNLAQAVLIFAYETNRHLLQRTDAQAAPARPGQRDRLIAHVLELAEETGFILPGDPCKMRPRLEAILSRLPAHIPEVRTLHGLLEQISRTVKSGKVEYRGRFKRMVDGAGDVPIMKDVP